jgi:imidazolonepropionase-like amidohydrolase
LKTAALALCLMLIPAPAGRAQASPRADVVIKAKRIITVSGEEIADGVIVVSGGKIKAVGKGIDVPADAVVVEAAVVMPGLVNGSSMYGLSWRANEEAREVTAEARGLDEVDGNSPDFKRALQTGVTTAYVGPADRNVIGGLGAVVKTGGGALKDRIVADDMALKAAFGPAPTRGNYPPRGATPANFYARRPTTRMGVTWEFRKAFLDAKKHREEGGAKDEGKDVLLRALDRKLTMRISASRSTDIEAVLKVVEEFDLDAVLEEANEAYLHAVALSQRKISVLLRPSFLTRTIYSRDGSEERFGAFAGLLKAGIRTGLLPAGEGDGEGLLATAAFAVKYGASRGDALRAITLTPAEILGVSDRVGSLGAGKDADLLLLNGDPLDVKTRVERVIIGGSVVFGKPVTEY